MRVARLKKEILAKETTVTTHGISYTFATNNWIEFYPSGKVEKGRLAQDTPLKFGGILYIFDELYFDRNGKVKGGGLSNPLAMSIGGKEYQFQEVHFDNEGKIIQIQLSTPLTIKGEAYETWTWIQLYNDGSFAGTGTYDETWTGVKQ